MKYLPLLYVILTACTHGAVHIENDILSPTKNRDEFFTHGTQFSYIDQHENEQETYSIGQTIFTPSTKKPDADPQILKRDRPYAGFLYGEYRRSLRRDDGITDTFGISAGCVGGECSKARWSQQTVHKLINQGKPAWIKSDELKNEPGFIIEAERQKKEFQNGYSDLALYLGGKFGNIIDSIFFGGMLRGGYNLDTFPSTPIVFKLPEEENKHFVAYVFVKPEVRAVAFNELLDGSMFQSEPHTVRSLPLVGQIDIGFTIGWKSYKFTYSFIHMTEEWKGQPGNGFSFGSIDYSW